MKFVGIILLGIVAAVCMAGLMVFLPPYFRGATAARSGVPEEVQVLVAAKPIPAMKIVDADSVVTKTLRRQNAPEFYLSDPAQVVGKVLLVPMTAGQAYSKNYFASDGSGLQLASALPNGMRAVGVSLSDYSGLEGLLYPGCRVDVLASFKPIIGNEATSKTLLQNIQVLGIEDITIVSTDATKQSTNRIDRSRKKMVSLMVDPEQAKMLQTAMQEGTISLSMRNPLDATPVQQLASANPAKPKSSDDPGWELTVLHDGKPETTVFKQYHESR